MRTMAWSWSAADFALPFAAARRLPASVSDGLPVVDELARRAFAAEERLAPAVSSALGVEENFAPLPSHAVPIPTANTAAWVRMRLERFMGLAEKYGVRGNGISRIRQASAAGIAKDGSGGLARGEKRN